MLDRLLQMEIQQIKFRPLAEIFQRTYGTIAILLDKI